MKRAKRILALLSCLIVLVAGLAVTASAASYPLIYPATTCVHTIPKGEVGVLRFTIWPEFKNEKYHIEIYNSEGKMVGSASDSYYNASTSLRTISITVDTDKLGMGIGSYTVKYWTSFYSLYEWHTSPNQYTYTIHVIKNVCKGNHNLVVDEVITEGTCQKKGTVEVHCTKCDFWGCEERYGDHIYGAYSENDASTHKTTCTVCGDPATEEHFWGDGVVTYPTETANGYTTYECLGCFYQKVENYTFPDVRNNAWYYNAVEFAVRKGYFSGHGNGNFAPSDPITRQDFVVVLSRIAGADLTGYTGETAFTDVKSNAYYAKAIQWATENGIIGGYNATTFGVGDKLTREQLVTIMYRYAKNLGVDVTVTTGWDLMSEYPDATAPNPNLREMVAWALEKGIISGKQVNGKTCIAPQASATRAETAQILLNISTKGLIPGI